MLINDDDGKRKIFNTARVVAIVGFSSNESKGAHYVPKYLQEQGYKIVPVNPTLEVGLGEKAYASLSDIPFAVDVVDCFRRPEAMPDIAREAVKIGAKVLWMQEGIKSDEAAKIANDGGLDVVQDACMFETHRDLMATDKKTPQSCSVAFNKK